MSHGPCLLTRPGCGLCDAFHAQWQQAFPGIDLPKVNVDRDAALLASFGDMVPVLLDEADAPVCSVRFDQAACVALARRLGAKA